MSFRVIRAAAGCGKTTALATAYLELVASGVSVDRIIAITFTRRAAAELIDRVGLALRAATGDVSALQALGSAKSTYLNAAPSDPDVALAALADLGSAPIGTTDHFVNQLLAEFALDAELELPDGRLLPLDVGLVPVTDLRPHLDAAARRLLAPPNSPPPEEVETLTRYFRLAEILQLLCESSELDGMPSLSSDAVLRRIATRVAESLIHLDFSSLLKVPAPTVEAWTEQLRPLTKPEVRWTLDPVASWMANGAVPSEAPHAFLSWARALDGRSSIGRALLPIFRTTAIDFGITTVRVDHILSALRHPYEQRAHLELADQLRAAVETLRMQVASEALETAALHGELPHVHLTRAATRLAKSAVLHGRFGALLVDEVQDADPDQLALYEALAAHPEIRCVFVGDGRQSIYLFRGGEPAGLARLTERAAQSGEVEARLRNYRSSPSLVEAHRALFQSLARPMSQQCFEPLESLDALEAEPSLRQRELDPAFHEDPRPVWLIRNEGSWVPGADDRALVVFYQRLQDAWREPGHRDDTAAVLCPTWKMAQRAATFLRKLAGNEDAAWVEGGDGWLRQGVGRDIAMWLRALLDPTDAIAWLAVWKHPSLGLSDGALAKIRGGGIQLGRLHHGPGLSPPHLDVDVQTVDRARPLLTEAMERIGRDDTAAVLDDLFHALHWRMLVAAGPAGADELARMEVLLDWIGEKDAEGQSVDAIAKALLADQRMDVPRVRLDRAHQTITCTTVFQSKGLAWDHVAVLSPGRAGRLQVDAADVWADFGDGPHRLIGLTFDPQGGLLPFQDPLRRLAHTIRKARFAEEGARLAYVAVTRARRSVTIGLPKRVNKAGLGMADAQRVIATTWPTLKHPSIAIHQAPPLPPEIPLPLHEVRPAVEALPLPRSAHNPVLYEIAPSAAAARYSREQREVLAEHVRSRVLFAGGFRAGQADLPPPIEHHPAFTPADWGTLAHGWFAAWGFRSEPDQALASRYLIDEWGRDDRAVRDWLLRISARMQGARGSLWELVTDPASRLFFEYPLVGVGGPNDDLLFSGRVDLLVARKKGVVIIDFKAGGRSPSSAESLIDGASLTTYGPQLDAYRGALERLGLNVLQTSLWFVRTGAQVTW